MFCICIWSVCICMCACLCGYDWSITTQLSPSQMVQIWMPAWWVFQPQWGQNDCLRSWKKLEDRMRHKLDLLTKDNESDMQLSNLIFLRHAENIQRRAVSQIEAKNMFRCSKRHLSSHVLSEDLARDVTYYTIAGSILFLQSFLNFKNINHKY